MTQRSRNTVRTPKPPSLCLPHPPEPESPDLNAARRRTLLLSTLIPARACTFIIGAGSVIIIVRRWPALRGEQAPERGALVRARSGIRDILGQGVGNHYDQGGSVDIFSRTARFGVVLSISFFFFSRHRGKKTRVVCLNF